MKHYTAEEIADYYDSHPNLTLRELSNRTGKSVAYLKGLLMHTQTGHQSIVKIIHETIQPIHYPGNA